jgi:hypothetical protein
LQHKLLPVVRLQRPEDKRRGVAGPVDRVVAQGEADNEGPD